MKHSKTRRSSRSVDLFSFVQFCQRAAGVWLEPDDGLSRFVVVRKLLAMAPRETVELERALAALVLSTFAIKLSGDRQPDTPAWPKVLPPVEVVRQLHVKHVIRSIFARCSSSLTLPGVASEEGLSASYLSRLLTSETGFGFEDLLYGARVLRATVLARDPTLRVKEIAADAGFRSTGELDRQFARAFAITPSVFRRTLIAANYLRLA